MTAAFTALVYHGCDVVTRERIIRGDWQLLRSSNFYDWLGDGLYAYIGDPGRALAFAQRSHNEPASFLSAKGIANPSVLGLVVSMEFVMDMNTEFGRIQYQVGKESVTDMRLRERLEPHLNDGNRHVLDRAIFNAIHQSRAEDGEPELQGVVAHYRDGDELSPGSQLYTDSRSIIAIHDLSCVVGSFRLEGESALTDEEMANAVAKKEAYQKLVSGLKPRYRAVAYAN